MSTSTTLYNRAIQLFEQNMNGERENPKFKKFKQVLRDNGVSLDSDQLVTIYDDITPSGTHAISKNNASYSFNKQYAKRIAYDIVNTICMNLPETPTSASDIIYNTLSTSYCFCDRYVDEYVRQCNVPKVAAYSALAGLHTAIENLVRRTLKQLAKEGMLKETPIYTCGKLYIRLYSLA